MLEIGIRGTSEYTVTEERLATSVGSGAVSVLATPMMIAGMEGTAAASVQPYLETEQTTVGIHLDVTHDAATPCGMKVRFESELVAIDGKILTFAVQAFDEKERIGGGSHKRAIVKKTRFEERAQAKLG